MKIFKNIFRQISLLCLLFLASGIADISSLWAQEKTKIFIIPVSGDVDPGMAAYVERALKTIQEDSNSVIVFEMDTFGGRVDSALEIVDHITNIPKSKTISYVTNKAISAGALIALASSELAMKHGTTIGDCAPIMMSSEGPKMMGEKFQSPLRAKFRALAKKNHYPELLAESMVSMDKEVFEIITGDKKSYIDAQDYNDLNETEKKKISSKKTIVAKGELLTMDDIEALELGFSKISTDNIEDMLKKRGYENFEIIRIQESWSETFVRYIGSISSILMMIGFGALYVEYKSPGFGLPGMIGVLCLGLVFFNQYLVGLAGYTEFLIFLIGILLLAVELFVLPGFGIAGISGLLIIGISMILMLQDFVLPDPTLPWQGEILIKNLTQVFSSFIFAFILSILFFRYVVPNSSGFISGPFLKKTLKESHADIDKHKNIVVGDIGLVDTFLRPSGKVSINQKIYDAKSEGEFIEKGMAIKVVKLKNNQIIVIKK
jgi:membrane-bound serine protease (ClpP class)